jgi:hypothetical protein
MSSPFTPEQIAAAIEGVRKTLEKVGPHIEGIAKAVVEREKNLAALAKAEAKLAALQHEYDFAPATVRIHLGLKTKLHFQQRRVARLADLCKR